LKNHAGAGASNVAQAPAASVIGPSAAEPWSRQVAKQTATTTPPLRQGRTGDCSAVRSEASSSAAGAARGQQRCRRAGPLKSQQQTIREVREAMARAPAGDGVAERHHHHGREIGQDPALGMGGPARQAKHTPAKRRDRWSAPHREGAALPKPAQRPRSRASTQRQCQHPTGSSRRKPGQSTRQPEEHERQLQRQGPAVFIRFQVGRSRRGGQAAPPEAAGERHPES